MTWLNNWLAPERHEGWRLYRILYGMTMLAIWLPRGIHFEERFTTAGAKLRGTVPAISDLFMLSPTAGWIVYGVLLLGSATLIAGRLPRVSVVLVVAAHVVLCLEERLNYKGYDRLMFWQAFAILLAPGRVDGAKTAVPIARYYLTLLFMCLYASTGWYKFLDEPGWQDGSTLATHMLDMNFGLLPLGVWASRQSWLMVLMGWATIVFEIGFPLLWLIRRVRPWLLLVGVSFHLGILMMLNVPNFVWASLIAYPMLLNPEQYKRIHTQAVSWIQQGR